MKVIKTDIIPAKQTFVKINQPHEINYEAICVFVAIGFFLDQDCYYKDEICLRPATINSIDDNGFLVKSEPWFKWHYTPQKKTFNETLEEFTNLFETIIDEQTGTKKVILPISGGLDSRTQAAALNHLEKNVSAYSYEFVNGYNETKISEAIAKTCNFPFQKFEVRQNYLWRDIEKLAKINGCYAEFTHPRQMSVFNELKPMGDVFSLGHWGDVLFDKQVDKELAENEMVEVILKKITKKGGIDLASQLWKSWSLDGVFLDYLSHRIKSLLKEIDIDNSNAKIRAFKSLFWAPRWTTANLSIFENIKPITLPYYDNRMCEFICGIPEEYLANRKLQIAYIIKRSKGLAKITWEENKPYNLFNYKNNKTPYNLPYRFANKLKLLANSYRGKQYVQRNWELQFLGQEAEKYLQKYLIDSQLEQIIPKSILTNTYQNFKDNNKIQFSHPLSMLLTLSLWQSIFNNSEEN